MWTKENLISTCMSYLGQVYKKDSTINQRVKKGLSKFNNIELDSLKSMLMSIYSPAGTDDPSISELENLECNKLLKESKTKRIKPPPVSYEDVSTLKMTSGNEKKISKVILNGNIEEWVGIGWVTLQEAEENDYYLYPEVK